MGRIKISLLAIAMLAAACSGSAGDDAERPNDEKVAADDAIEVVEGEAEPPGSGACDPSDASDCLLPWPSDRLTRSDPATETGRRLDLPADGMPATVAGVAIDPTEWNRNDGFAPSSRLLVHLPGVDPEASGLPPITDIGASLDDDSALVLIDAEAGARVAAWAELDANAEDPDGQALIITPAQLLDEGRRYVVALRGLTDGDGEALDRPEGFADLVADPDPEAQAVLDTLDDAGVAIDEVTIAWGFTTGSVASIAGRLQHMWAETEAEIGEGAVPFTVTSEEEPGPARLVEASFEVPKYLTGDGGPGSFLANEDDADGLPSAAGTMTADVLCTVPTSATADDPAPAVIYGHGLLGSRQEVLGLGTLGASVGLMFCAVDFIGMSTADVETIVASFEDLSTFRTLPDRLQQAHLSVLVLGRLLRSDEGFASDPTFQVDGEPIIDTGAVSFLGASQGGILGGAPSSLTNDWANVILAVPGQGYNLLLRRSVNFDAFGPALEASHPDELDRTIILELLQQLWQRGENAGYAQHLVDDPFEGVEPKRVLLLEAFGDHQVANVSTENLARTLGIGRVAPTLGAGRSPDVEPFWGIEPIESLPLEGSGLVVWDFGTEAPPTENVPNRAGSDPHGSLSNVPAALSLVLAFATEGRLIDVCGEQPCATVDG